MWNYMYYIAYLKWKKSDEYTGIESYVAEKLLKDDFTWYFFHLYVRFPFNKTREFDNIDDEGEEEVEKNLISDINTIVFFYKY